MAWSTWHAFEKAHIDYYAPDAPGVYALNKNGGQ